MNRTCRSMAGLVLGMVFCTFAASGLTAAEAPLQTQPLEIVVLDATTKTAIAGAEVTWRDGADPGKVVTDANGSAILQVRRDGPAPEKDTRFSVGVSAPGHEQRTVEWFSDAGRVREDLPARFEVGLKPGVTAGGVVRDEQGRPIRGARIQLFASGMRPRRLGRGDKSQQEYGMVSIGEQDALQTDEEGRWKLEHFPVEVTQLYVDVLRPDGGRARFAPADAHRGPGERVGVVEVAQLQAQSAVFTLKDGFTLRGLVVDEAGQPLPGVQLRARDAASRYPPELFVTDAQGRFERPHWEAAAVLITAEKVGRQSSSVTAPVGNDAAPVKLVLGPARPLRLRVVADNDVPIVGAEVQTDLNPAPDQIVSWRAKTDEAGRVEWPTAPDRPVNLWIAPPPGSDIPFRSARLQADGTEHVVRVRRGAGQSVRVHFRVVDAETGAPVPRFEVWRRTASQSFRPWGEPAEGGEFTKELPLGDLPNGFVLAYQLQVRAAGYTGWSSERLDFSNGDQDHLVKLAKGESVFAPEAPPRDPRAGLDGERSPELLVLAGAVVRLLESGDAAEFARVTNASLDDWRRLLPAGAGEKDLPLGADPGRLIARRAKTIEDTALHVLELARRAGVVPGRMRFTTKAVTSRTSSRRGFRIGNQPVMMTFTPALRVMLAGEPVDGVGADRLRGDYELCIGDSRQFPSGWRIEEGIRWSSFPPGLADEPLRRELSLANRIAPATPGDQPMLGGMDDPALLGLGAVVVGLLRDRSVPAFLAAATLSREELGALYGRFGWGAGTAADEARQRIADGLTGSAEAMLAFQQRLGVDMSDARVEVKQVLAQRPGFARFGEADGIRASPVQVTLTVASDRLAKSGRPLAGTYVVAIGEALRTGDRWVIMGDKIRFQEFPAEVVGEGDRKDLEFENHVADHGTLPPGTAAPEVFVTQLSNDARLPLAAFRGKVVILEFWATWCGPCQEPMEKLQRLLEEHPEWKDHVEIIALSIDEQAAEARRHLEERGWSRTLNVWAGEGGWRSPPVRAFRVRGVPTSYVLDREGRVVQAGHPGSMDLGRIVGSELKKGSR